MKTSMLIVVVAVAVALSTLSAQSQTASATSEPKTATTPREPHRSARPAGQGQGGFQIGRRAEGLAGDVAGGVQQLAARLNDLKAEFKATEESSAATAQHVAGSLADMQRAIEKLRGSPESYAIQRETLQALDGLAGELEDALRRILDPKLSNPADVVQRLGRTLDELSGVCKADADTARNRAQNAPAESLRKAYLLVADACDRNVRTYSDQKKHYEGMNLSERLNEFAEQLEFVVFYRGHVQKLAGHLEAIEHSQDLIGQLEGMTASLDQLAQALVDFSKIVSGQYQTAQPTRVD